MDEEYAKYILEKTRDDYNRIARSFSSSRSNVWEEMKFLFDDYIKPGDRVLDLGCGNGRFYEVLKSKDVDYVGVDFSKELIEIARKKYPGVRFQVADALDLPFESDCFDRIYGVAIFHHIPSEKLRLRFLKEARRVLKFDGLLIITVWRFTSLKEKLLSLKYNILKLFSSSKLDFWDVFEPWGKEIKRYYHLFSKNELRNLLLKSGYKIEEIGTVKNKRKTRENVYVIAKREY